MYTGIQNEIQVLNNDLKYLFSETLFNGVPLLRYIPEIFGRLVVICESVSNLEISNEKEDNKRLRKGSLVICAEKIRCSRGSSDLRMGDLGAASR